VRCPRCHAASALDARSCARCGAPLLFHDDPPPVPLDLALHLDRRYAGRGLSSGPSPERAGEDVEESPGLPCIASPPGAASCEPGGAFGQAEAPDPLPQAEEAAEIHVDTAPGWRRAAAWGIDLIVLATAGGPPLLLAWYALPAGPDILVTLVPTFAAFAALLGFAYAALGHALMGATFGKRLLGLQVVGPDGAFPGLARSAARSGLAVMGAAGLGVGVLMALFTRSGRSLHDLIADTVVIRTP